MSEFVTFAVNREISARATIEVMRKNGWEVLGEWSVLETISKCSGGDAELKLFQVGQSGKFIPARDVQRMYQDQNLNADVQAFVQYAQISLDWIVHRLIGMQWQDKDDNHCYVAFYHGNEVRRIAIGKHPGSCPGGEIFVGCRIAA